MSAAIVIRLLASADRAAVRRLCGDTADRGEPVEGFFSDRLLVVDLLTRYYTDLDRSCSWVAESDGQLAGYVLAAADSRAVERAARLRIAPAALIGAVLRGALGRAETWRMIRAARANVRRLATRRPFTDAAYPAHLHINLDVRFRSHGLGGDLLEAALRRLRQTPAAGVHASVRADSIRACRFFETHGFAVVHRDALTFPVSGGTELREVLLYGLSFQH